MTPSNGFEPVVIPPTSRALAPRQPIGFTAYLETPPRGTREQVAVTLELVGLVVRRERIWLWWPGLSVLGPVGLPIAEPLAMFRGRGRSILTLLHGTEWHSDHAVRPLRDWQTGASLYRYHPRRRIAVAAVVARQGGAT